MKSVAKKVLIYSMVGLMQVGLFASVTEAAVKQNEPTKYEQREGSHQGDQDKERKIREENERHEKEMKRRPNESDREWQKRQQQENERHDRELRQVQNH